MVPSGPTKPTKQKDMNHKTDKVAGTMQYVT